MFLIMKAKIEKLICYLTQDALKLDALSHITLDNTSSSKL